MVTRDTEFPQEALEWLRAGETFDVVVVDIQMPDMDGVTLARQVRHLSAAPIVAWTSVGRREPDTQDLFAAYLQKPMRPSLFFDVMASFFFHEYVPVVAKDVQFQGDVAASHPLRILVADDIFVNQKMLMLMLERMGYTSTSASNGLEVLQALGSSTFEVILMDINMPEMDGLQATKEIIAHYGSARPRIIALTANVTVEERKTCADVGMDDFLGKPVQIEDLRLALLRCPPTPLDLLDRSVVETLRKMGPEIVSQVLEMARRDLPPLIAQVMARTQAKDGPGLWQATHSLKGASGNLATKALSKRCGELEKAAKAEDFVRADELAAGLGKLWEDSLEALERSCCL
jgi:CheY-like chemotaxis protein